MCVCVCQVVCVRLCVSHSVCVYACVCAIWLVGWWASCLWFGRCFQADFYGPLHPVIRLIEIHLTPLLKQTQNNNGSLISNSNTTTNNINYTHMSNNKKQERQRERRKNSYKKTQSKKNPEIIMAFLWRTSLSISLPFTRLLAPFHFTESFVCVCVFASFFLLSFSLNLRRVFVSNHFHPPLIRCGLKRYLPRKLRL